MGSHSEPQGGLDSLKGHALGLEQGNQHTTSPWQASFGTERWPHQQLLEVPVVT